MLEKLEDQRPKSWIASGDSETRVRRIAGKPGVKSYYARMSPKGDTIEH